VVLDQTGAGALTHIGDGRCSSAFIRICLRDCQFGPVGCQEPEPDVRVGVCEQLDAPAMVFVLPGFAVLFSG
jgi:hypothetical protein